ncbi:MAG: glycosyl transferase [Chitinophagaceae bacterium]|nr:MAG: glycosyl transferase [Chitinophagaceae bacterium]
MKIFYAVQATGNGHISRAMELLPHLKKYGEVDIFLSGSNSTLPLNAPVAFRSQGLSLQYTCHGSLNYLRTLKQINFKRIRKEASDLPLKKYDLVLNDFEPITSLACKLKDIPSIHFGHQASFTTNKTPRPSKKNRIGEWILKNYASGTCNVGLHFNSYDDFIEPPVIKSEIWIADVVDKGHITVYLPSYCDKELITIFLRMKDIRFEIFSRQAKKIFCIDNISLLPVNKSSFNKSLISCRGIITSAGFETPSEALYLNKKLLVIPIKGQYEQLCNAAALRKMGIKVLDRINHVFYKEVAQWLLSSQPDNIIQFKPTVEIVDALVRTAYINQTKFL